MFKGKLVLVCGINNSLSAANTPNVVYHKPSNSYVNGQDFEALFELLDKTVKRMMPNATCIYTPLIAPNERTWKTSHHCQFAFKKINQLIKERKHLELDSDLPVQMKWIRGRDKVHMDDIDGVRFWKMIFHGIDSTN